MTQLPPRKKYQRFTKTKAELRARYANLKPRKKALPGEVYHSEETIRKISETQKKNVEEKTNNLTRMLTCQFCNATMQENMIIRWHGPKCDILNYIWDYASPAWRRAKQRGQL